MTTLLVNDVRTSGPGRNVAEGIVIGVVLTGASYLVGLGAGWIENVNWLEAFAVFTSYVCTYLCVKERRINYPIGAASTAAYSVLAFRADLFSTMALNAWLTLQLVYGWFRWRKDSEARPVTFVGAKWWPVYLAVTAGFYFGASSLSSHFGGSSAWTDAVILAGSILAQFLLDNKKMENWAVWFIVDLFAMYVYFHAGLFLVGFQYIFFTANTFYGWFVWNRSRKMIAPEPAAIPAVSEA